MRRIIVAACLALTLAGCQAFSEKFQALKTVYSIATEKTVSPTQVIVAANAFDGLQATATQYLVYCKSNLQTSVCSAVNRRNVIKYVRSGRAARTQLETSIASGQAAPATIYNTLVAAINALNKTPAATGAPRQ